ncbi:MAG: hypothetical protein ABIH24_10665 [Verrucomicrobiota bacterium]
MQTWLKYPIILLVGMLTAFVLTPIIRRLAIRGGVIDLPDERRIHKSPIPRGGGLSIYFGFHAACAVLFLVPWNPFVGKLDIQWWQSFLLISTWLALVGLLDDARGLRPIVKLLGQIVAASAAYAADIRAGNALGFYLPPIVDFATTVIWILVFVNAFNLIDGLDGLATGLAIIAAMGIGGGLLFRHMPGDVLVCLGFIGACLAFLRYNFHPASVFLGDTGSMFIGLTLACISLSTASKGAALASVAVPLLAIGVPVFDVILAVWRRMARRIIGGETSRFRVMKADTDHLHHRLVRSGLSQKSVATWLYGLAAILVTLALAGMLYRVQAAGIFLLAFAAGAFVIVKHLARVELWDSGTAILHGLRRPTGKVMAVISYPVIDICILSGSLWISLWLVSQDVGLITLKAEWLDNASLWIGVPFIALVIGQTYRRVWSRARLSEIVELELVLVMGIVACMGLAMIFLQEGGKALLLKALLFAGFSISGVVITRVFLRVLQDVLVMTSRHPMLSGRSDLRPAVVYGAGSRGTLYLRRRSAEYPLSTDNHRIIGVIDDDSNLHGRLVYGYNVLGGVKDLPRIVELYRVRDVIIAAELKEENRLSLLDFARKLNLVVWEWTVRKDRLNLG